jgi:hypothetical protein
LDGSLLWVWGAPILDLGAVSCFEDRIESRDDLAETEAQVDPGMLRVPPEVEVFGSGGTAYAVCFETGDGGAPVGTLCFDGVAAAVDDSGPTGLKFFDFWILPIRPSPFFRLRKR